MVLAIVVALMFHAAMYGPQASFFSELFGTRVRYSGASLGYQLASVIAGGLSPLIATGLLKRYGASWPISLYVVGLALVTLARWIGIRDSSSEIHARLGGKETAWSKRPPCYLQ